MIFRHRITTRRIAQDAREEAGWAVAKASDAVDLAQEAVNLVRDLRRGHFLLCLAVLLLSLWVFSLARAKNV